MHVFIFPPVLSQRRRTETIPRSNTWTLSEASTWSIFRWLRATSLRFIATRVLMLVNGKDLFPKKKKKWFRSVRFFFGRIPRRNNKGAIRQGNSNKSSNQTALNVFDEFHFEFVCSVDFRLNDPSNRNRNRCTLMTFPISVPNKWCRECLTSLW